METCEIYENIIIYCIFYLKGLFIFPAIIALFGNAQYLFQIDFTFIVNEHILILMGINIDISVFRL